MKTHLHGRKHLCLLCLTCLKGSNHPVAQIHLIVKVSTLKIEQLKVKLRGYLEIELRSHLRIDKRTVKRTDHIKADNIRIGRREIKVHAVLLKSRKHPTWRVLLHERIHHLI